MSIFTHFVRIATYRPILQKRHIILCMSHNFKVTHCGEHVTNNRETHPKSMKTNLMRKIVQTSLLIAAVGGLTTAAQAQTIVVASDNFDTQGAGPYGGVAWNFNGTVGNPAVSISYDNPQGTNNANCVFSFDTTSGYVSGGLNFGWRTAWLTATNNTNALLSDYTLEFDLAVGQGVDMSTLGGYVGPTVGVVGDNGGIYYKENAFTNFTFPTMASGYQHYSIPLTGFAKVGGSTVTVLDPRDNPLSMQIGLYAPNYTYFGYEEIDIANLAITMITNVAPPPPPTLNILPAKPGLRIFAENTAETYNQEGFGTVDTNQSWVNAPAYPVSYAITFQDFNTVNGYAFYMQMAGNNGGSANNPFLIYQASNTFVWTIAANNTGFTWSLDWKTNLPNNGTVSNVTRGVSTSTNGVGTWTLTFTDNLHGTVTPPGGPAAPFTLLSADWATNFANPMSICFGQSPNNPLGEGQYIDISRISITNVAGTNEYSDFTTNAVFDTKQWTAGFSVDPSSVIQVSTNTPFWVNWTVPAIGYGLGTKASLTNASIPWHSPGYYSGGITNIPAQMGNSLIWLLYPASCLPSADGVAGDPTGPNAFFQLSNPPPSP
jgi:hypothetical protein